MRRLVFIAAVVVASLLAAGCAGQRETADGRIALSAIENSSLSGVSWSAEGRRVAINISALRDPGLFVHLALPAGCGIVKEEWPADDRLIHLAVQSGDGVDLGVAPVNGAALDNVSAVLYWGARPRCTSQPPKGGSNAVIVNTEIVATNLLRFTWTQRNIGDYDLNGEVSIADLTPIAQNFGKRYQKPNSADAASLLEENPLYWIDGDHNTLINLSDIVTIAQNYKTFVHGYLIKKNGVPVLGDDGKVLVLSGKKRQLLPPRYEYVADNSDSAQWRIIPVDNDLLEGIDSTDCLSTDFDWMDLRITADLRCNPYEYIEPGPLKNVEVVRIIDPIDWPGRKHLEPDYCSPSGALLFNGLVREREFAINLSYVPDYLLESGTANTALQPYIMAIPLMLPEGNVHYEYDVNITVDQMPDHCEVITSAVINGDASKPYFTLLDTGSKLLSLDTNFDGSFADEVWLNDSDLNGESDALTEYQLVSNEYLNDANSVKQRIVIRAGVAMFDEATGTLMLLNEPGNVPRDITDDYLGVEMDPDRSYYLQFNERTKFSIMDSDTLERRPMNIKTEFKPLEQVFEITADRWYNSGALGEQYWITDIMVYELAP